MRNSEKRFLNALQDYLKKAITERVNAVNAENPDIRLPDIALWQSGYRGALSGLTHYPGCLTLINGRTLIDPYTTSFNVAIGVGLTADDPDYLEEIGRLYLDILEDAIRADWHLGGAALDTALGASFMTDCVNNVYLIEIDLECQVDIGGFIYEDTDTDSEDSGEVLPVSEMPGSEGTVSSGEGDGILSPLRDADDADNEGIGREEASVQLEAKESE